MKFFSVLFIPVENSNLKTILSEFSGRIREKRELLRLGQACGQVQGGKNYGECGNNQMCYVWWSLSPGICTCSMGYMAQNGQCTETSEFTRPTMGSKFPFFFQFYPNTVIMTIIGQW